MALPLKLAALKNKIFSARYLRRLTIKKGWFSDSQIMGNLERAEGRVPVCELCKEHGISSASISK